MQQNQNIVNALIELGKFLSQFSTKGIQKKDEILNNDLFFDGFKHQIKLAEEHNGWFTENNILYALETWSKQLIDTNINKWLKKYSFNKLQPKNIAVIMAGNIPLVGFHDFICVLVSGHNIIVKQSSNDKHLLPFITKFLELAEPTLKGKITFSDEKLQNFDAVIATGSDNTARYFEYYFKNKPSIIRKNRNSAAVLTGNETEEDLELLSEDIFRYFGLGCRNVAKLFIPAGYNFDGFFKAVYKWHPLIEETKYANNYDYNKAVYLMSEFDILENGFLMLKEDDKYASPIATLFYETYSDLNNLREKLNVNKDKIQCVVADGILENEVRFGETQSPKLWDFADGVDTVDFLLKI